MFEALVRVLASILGLAVCCGLALTVCWKFKLSPHGLGLLVFVVVGFLGNVRYHEILGD